LTYGIGSDNGTFYTDTVELGSLVLNNYKFLVVNTATEEGNQSDGLIGVGPKQLAGEIAGGNAPTFI